jgi:hypothetical protein
MYRNVEVSCSHCGDSKTMVGDTEAIPEVPASYEAAGSQGHIQTYKHQLKRFDDLRNAKKIGADKPVTEVKGRLSELVHGKEHNG